MAEDVGALRRAVDSEASFFGGLPVGAAALVATELATNLLLHTDEGGYVLHRALPDGIELVAIDRGPGMPHAPEAASIPRTRVHPELPRVHSELAPVHAGRGLGAGLSTAQRLSTTFDLYSTKPDGTVVLARLLEHPPESAWCRWGAVNVAFDGGAHSGDGWAVDEGTKLAALVVDGLGHGPEAGEAAAAAVSVFCAEPGGDLRRFIEKAHEAMRPTRGGMVAECVIDPIGDELVHAGIGNISTRVVLGTRTKSVLSREGSVGTEIAPPRARLEHCDWGPGALLVMSSDGIRGHWDLGAYPGLVGHDPTVVAAILLRDFGRDTDDSTVLVVQDRRRQA